MVLNFLLLSNAPFLVEPILHSDLRFNLSAGDGRTAVGEAMSHVSAKTKSCITFVPRTNQASYVRFFPGGG